MNDRRAEYELKLFIDDERYPPEDGSVWVVIRNYDETIAFLDSLDESPSFISFDNDLGKNSQEGFKIVDWIIEKDLNCGGTWISKNFDYYVHSQNPVRKDYIIGTLTRYLNFKKG